MKTTLFALIVVILSPVVFAQQSVPQPPLITTTGSAEIRVVPDLADLYFEVEVRNVDLTAARKQEADKITKVLAALRTAGIAEKDLRSSQVQVSADYTDRHQETEKVRFYRVSQSISATLHEVKKVPDVTAEAIAAGASAVRDATLRTSELRKYRDEARAKAIRAAKDKAMALATELGAKVGKPYSISEGADWRAFASNNARQNVSSAGEPSDDETNATFALGTISISANVTVAFILE